MKHLNSLFASRRRAAAPALFGLLLALPVLAHHSFAVFFDDSRTVSVTGTVVEFRFLNPHGVKLVNGKPVGVPLQETVGKLK